MAERETISNMADNAGVNDNKVSSFASPEEEEVIDGDETEFV